MNGLENIPDSLSSIEKKNCFSTPENYFNTILPKIQKKITTNNETSYTFIYRLKPVYILVSLIILFAGYFYFSRINTKQHFFSESEYLEYLSSETDENQIIESGIEIYQNTKNDSTKEIINYLIDNNVEYLSLIDEY